VLFTDIVDSTRRATELGDASWRVLLERHNGMIRTELARWRGKEIETTGDGFLATFDGPARAMRCARSITSTVRSLGIEVRCGLHTGEVESVGGEVTGIAVHLGARISALAGPSEVLVSRTVKDLVAGSGLRFAERGIHVLKGLSDPWELFALKGDDANRV
jgi:class 3 adenylate cyclase